MKSIKAMIILVITLLALTIEITSRKALRHTKKWKDLSTFTKWGPGKAGPFQARVPGVCAACRKWCTKFTASYFHIGADAFLCECLVGYGHSKDGTKWEEVKSDMKAKVVELVASDDALKLPC